MDENTGYKVIQLPVASRDKFSANRQQIQFIFPVLDIMRFQGPATEKSMVGWFYSKLEESVTKIKNKRSYDKWEAGKDPVKVLHHSDNGCRIKSLIPAFFSALAVQFIGKVSRVFLPNLK